MHKIRSFVVCLLFATLAVSAHAATYLVPSDREMIQRSDDVVIATGVTSFSERTASGRIVTRHTLRIEEVLKGERGAGQHLVLTELGGVLADGAALLIPGSPEYAPGQRYLVFTEANREGEPITFGMSLGQFELIEQRGRVLALREHIVGFDQNYEAHAEAARDAAGFTRYIRGIVAQRIAPEPTYFVVVDAEAADARAPHDRWNVGANAFSRGSYLLGGNFRWQNTPNANFVTAGTPPSGLNGDAAITRAVSEWNGTDSSIDYSKGGTDNSATGGLEDNDNKDGILYGDPNGEVNGAAVAIGGAWGSGQYSLDGETFIGISEADIVVNEVFSAPQCVFNSAMTHEMGHTLGLRHANQAPSGTTCGTTAECTSAAIMNSTVSCPFDGRLQTFDKNAAATVYGSGPACAAPTISTQPQSKSIAPGTSTSLSVTAAGTSPFTYQWYVGTVGNVSAPVSGGTGTSINVTPTATTSYWVRVTNACGTVDSSAATVTVSTCTAPTISTQPQSKNIAAGASTSLSVTAAGTAPLSYQWYIGTAGNVSTPVTGGTTASINVTPSATTTYWVRVTNSCGSIDSAAATVTIAACVAPTINTQPQNKSILQGTSTSLNVQVNGTGPFSYQWYIGNSGDESNPAAGTSAAINVTPSATTSYWVLVTNSCGRVASATATVTVTTCPVVNITNASASPVVLGSSTLTVTASSPGQTLSYAWFRGTTPGSGGTQVSTAASFSVPVTEPASYWARVTNACGQSAVSNLVTVAPCTLPSLTAEPVDQTIAVNGTATLALQLAGAATDTSITWYRGLVGDRSALVGNGPSVTVGPLTATTQYWAAIRNTCGEISSRQVTITVTTETCTAPAITTQPLSQTVTTGTVTLTVVATGSGTLQYQWFQGAAGDTSKPVGTDASFTANGVAQATSYWVRVTNACGTVDSSVAQITVPKGRRRAVGHR